MTLRNRLDRLERQLRAVPPSPDADEARRRDEARAVWADPDVAAASTAVLERLTGSTPLVGPEMTPVTWDDGRSLAEARNADPAVQKAAAAALARYRAGMSGHSGSTTGIVRPTET